MSALIRTLHQLLCRHRDWYCAGELPSGYYMVCPHCGKEYR